jgi:prepilin-type N-terminal cleavage/methylation domain-containing protein
MNKRCSQSIFSKAKTEIPKSQILNQVQDLVRDDRGTRTKSSCRAELGSASKGFTLIEIIIVIVSLSIVSAITIKFLVDSLRIYTMAVHQKTLFDEGKLAMERMCRDVRDARTLTTPVAGASGPTLTFTRNNATAQDSAAEAIRFTWSGTPGTALQKRKSVPSVLLINLASNVSTFTVTRGATGVNELTIDLTLSLASGEQVTLRTKVYPKNLATNATYKNFKRYWEEEEST